MHIFTLPDLGEGLPDAEIHEWHVKVGDIVHADQSLVSMETAKAVVEVPAPWSGEIAELHGKVGDIIKTGKPLVTFKDVTSHVVKPQDKGTVVGKLEISQDVLQEQTHIMQKTATTSAVKASPMVRQLAAQLKVDLANIQGSGPQNTITMDDVKTASTPKSMGVAHDIGTIEPLKGIRRTMARAMGIAHQEIVPVTVFDQQDIHAWSKETDITLRIIRAIVKACQQEPALNAWYDGVQNGRRLLDEVNLGLAMDSDDGLFVPVLKNVDALIASAPQTVREQINRYKREVKDRSIAPENLHQPSITLSNFGVFAGQFATPIVTPPQVAIIGCGKITEQVVARNGEMAIHRILPLSLTFDHRAVTGGEATRFLAAMMADLGLA